MTIELHTWNTPNGRKISVALEEMGLPYKVIPVNITKGEQMAPAFLKISPNNKIPAIVDPDGPGGKPVGIFESGAILLYLGETGAGGGFGQGGFPKGAGGAQSIGAFRHIPALIACRQQRRMRPAFAGAPRGKRGL